MAVYFYKEGDLSSMFTGFRAVQDTAPGKRYKQKYFSLKSMSYIAAKTAAEKQDAEWNAMRGAKKQNENKLDFKIQGKHNSRRLRLANNLGFTILKDRKGDKEYYYPAFYVTLGDRKGAFNRALSKDARQAWDDVVAKYREVYPLTEKDEITIDTLFPTFEKLLNFVAARLLTVNEGISFEEIKVKLKTAYSFI